MTGTVNPDGTIGPVGGVPLKVSAAIRKGKRVIGYPIGQGTARDPSSGEMVNVVELARDRGAEAVEIDDVEAAYALLTGEPRKQRKALSPRQMRTDDKLRKELRRLTQGWMKRALVHLTAARGAGTPPPELSGQFLGVEEQLEQARRYLTRGDTCAAYWQAISAEVEAHGLALLARLGNASSPRALADGLVDIRRFAGETNKSFEAMAERMRKRFERHARASLAEVDALEALVSAGIHVAEAGASLKGISKKLRTSLGAGGGTAALASVLSELTHPIFLLTVADVNMRLVDETLTLQALLGRRAAVRKTGRERFTTLFTRAAQANIHYFDTVYVEQKARSKGVSREVALVEILRSDRSYMAARAFLGMSDISQLGSDTNAQDTAELAAAMGSYFLSSSLVAQYDSFELKRDPRTGEAVKVGNKDVLWRMLALAERKAREHAARAKRKTGAVPMPALISYQIARVYQERPKLSDKLEALELFWRASMWSQLAANL